MAQMKEEIKTPEKELNKMEISNLSDVEFKTLVIRMLKEISEDFNSIKKIQTETKDTLIEMKNNLQGNNSAVNKAKNQLNDLEHKEAKKQPQNKKKESPKNENSMNSHWDNFMKSNIHLMGFQKEKRNSKKLEIYLNSERKLL